MAKRALTLLGLLIALQLAVSFEVTELLAWTDRLVPVSRYPALFAAFFLTWFLAARAPSRRAAFLVGSLTTAAIFDVGFLLLSIAWLAVLHRVLFSRAVHRVRWAVAFVMASFVAIAVGCNDGILVPGSVRVREDIAIEMRWAYLFAVGYALRLVALLHQVHVQRIVTVPFCDLLLYFIFAPFFVIVPYCLAIPRLDTFRAGLAAHDVAIERSGMRMVAWGILLAIGHALLMRVYDAGGIAVVAAREGEYFAAFVHGFVRYFVHAVLIGTSIAAILVGLVRVLGIDLGRSMNAPLRSTSVVEWWRRWNTHLRDLLVDVFYYPVVMRLRRKKRLAIVLGSAAVFLVGSTLLHWPKHYFRTGTWWPLGAMAENVVMFAIIALAMLRERGRKPAEPTLLRKVFGALWAWLLVYFAVVAVGYSVAHLTLGRL